MKTTITSISIKFGVFLLSLFAPIKELIVITLTLIVLDLIVGLWKSIKLKNKIQSRKLKRTIIKFVAYVIALLVGEILSSQLWGLPIANIVGAYVALTEAASIFENLAIITGNNLFIKIFDAIKTYFNKNKNIIDNFDISSTEEDDEINK